MSRSIVSLAVAASLLAACTSSRPVDAPVARNLTWFSYVGGDDIRAACAPGAAERYRLVYNGVYTEQVRSYDVQALPSHEGALMEVRVRGPARIAGVRLSAPLVPWTPELSRRWLKQFELEALVGALETSGVFEPAPIALMLRSGAFYWVIAACRGGAFHLNAFLHPSPRFDRLRFLPILNRLDPSDIAFNPPRKLDRPPPLPGQCTSRRHVSDECLFPPFLLTLGDGRLVGGGAL
ncbi:MAG: hypothetical protein ACE5LF_05985 [Alphaproteobacteria bacterium]